MPLMFSCLWQYSKTLCFLASNSLNINVLPLVIQLILQFMLRSYKQVVITLLFYSYSLCRQFVSLEAIRNCSK